MKTRLKELKIFLFPAITITLLFAVFHPENLYSVQDTVKLPAIQDNTLYENAAGLISNGQGKYLHSGKGSTGLIRRALVRFALVEFIPPCSKVLSVTLKMHLSGGTNIDKTIHLRKITENWGEGNSNAPGLEEDGTTAASFDATWIHKYYNTENWSTAGGTYSSATSGSSVVGTPGYYTWNSTPQMVSDVQAWLDNQSDALGWMLLGDESASSTAKRFHSSESDTVAFVPEITVVYQSAIFSLYMESLIEGFWDGTNMVEDTLKVKLRGTVSPYSIVDSDASVCGTYGGQFCFFNAPPGTYYISVHHRNSVETWSMLPITFAADDFQYYTFKDLASKAYGNNEVQKFGEYCFYSGDENQNGIVDASDLIKVYNDANMFLTGYVTSDLTGDNVVDITDVLIAFNNSNAFVGVMKP